MTISDKIRIYELSRDLNLENKDILDAAQKLSISVKSHSSSISAEDARKIKNLINKKNSDKKILAINKPSIKKDTYNKKIDDKSVSVPPIKRNPQEGNLNKKPLLVKPLNKPENPKIISNPPKNLNKPNIVDSAVSQAKLQNNNSKNKPSKDFNRDQTTFLNKKTPPVKTPIRPPIQLIEKPKNLTNNSKSNEPIKNIYKSGDKKQLLIKSDQNPNKPRTRNFNNRINTPELVGAPIRRDDPKINSNKKNSNKQSIPFKQAVPNRSGSPNRPTTSNRPSSFNRPGAPSRPSSFKEQANPSRVGKPGSPSRDSRERSSFRQDQFNRPSPKFNPQKPSGIRKPVSPNELLQLQKTNKSEKDKLGKIKNEKLAETSKQKAKAPHNRPNSAPSSKKQPNRTFPNNSKKPGRTDWDDSAKLEALRNKNPQKQRQKVHIIGENDDSLTSETSGYSGEKITILSASLARPKK